MGKNSNIQYQNRIVAYLDILGFKEIIRNENSDEIHKLITFIKTESNRIDCCFDKTEDGGPFLTFRDKNISLFSDSIIISVIPNPQDAQYNLIIKSLIDEVYSIQLEVLRFFKKFIRGAIVEGELFHDGNICFGPALLNAHCLESKHAIYPRVIIDNILYQKYLAEDKLINRDLDGYYYLDFLNNSMDHFVNNVKYFSKMRKPLDSDSWHIINWGAYQIDEAIREGLLNHDKKVKIKYEYLAIKFNEYLKVAIEYCPDYEYGYTPGSKSKKLELIPL